MALMYEGYKTNIVTRADHLAGPQQGAWTYAQYAALPDDRHRYEIVDGVLYMTPAPSSWHQEAVSRFNYYLLTHVTFAGAGKAFIAPFDVELAPNNVVQPDALVILQEHLDRVTDSRVVGSPDLVVEVASPSTAIYDRREKCTMYARAGVPEYWVADPATRTIEVLILENGEYHSLGYFEGSEALPSKIVPAIADVPVEKFFA